ncbi:hypothetical protein CS176_0582 [Corynebacterium glutamicum]|nr:hypothetical protein CS176_0582 [Corynebacterium glutamicum]
MQTAHNVEPITPRLFKRLQRVSGQRNAGEVKHRRPQVSAPHQSNHATDCCEYQHWGDVNISEEINMAGLHENRHQPGLAAGDLFLSRI